MFSLHTCVCSPWYNRTGWLDVKTPIYLLTCVCLQASGISRRYFQENGEWTVLKTWNERSEYTEDGYTYAKVTFYIKLQRRAVYYGLNTMLPVLLNSLLIPMVFLLPHDSGEKIGYCLTVLLAYVVILTIVTAGLPTTAKSQSLLGRYT